MKTIISLFVAIAFAIPTFAQESEQVDEFNFNAVKLPIVVISNIGEDFSVYLPENENLDNKINHIQNTFIAYELGKDFEGYENYLVYMEIKDASLVATYNENGKLVKVVEKYDNVKLPYKVMRKILKEYPHWKIIKDRYSYSQEDGDITKKQYDIIIQKGREVQKLVIAANGEFIKRHPNPYNE